MNVKNIAAIIDEQVPLKLAQDWDNVGLLVGRDNKTVKNILLTIDVTKDVVAEAKRLKTDLIVSYHPVIWDGLKQITNQTKNGVILELIQKDIAVFSIHTALDTVCGGVNDGLAEMIGINNPQPLGDFVNDPQGDLYKLVVYIPVESVNMVSKAIFDVGAGHIGNYSRCSFMAEGTGTFYPLQGANPSIGKRGKLEKVSEMRFETIVPATRLQTCIDAMLDAHPYETPAYDCFRLYNHIDKYGLGRIGKLAKPQKISTLIQKIKRATGVKAVGIVGNANRTATSAAVCAGTCGKIVNQAIAAGADLYLTGELKHHEALAAREAGLTCLCLSHTNSERFILKKFANQLKKKLKDVKISISKQDTDPFTWKAL